MAIADNGATEVGDEIFIESTLPITGVLSFDDWIDDTENETVGEFFTKDFSYSLDGIHWTDFQPLSTSNVQEIPVQSNYDTMFRFRYTRAGSSGSNIIVNWVKITTDDIVDSQCGITFENSIFSYFWDCHCSNNVLSWCQNVLEKLYRPGIVPQYISRGANGNQNQEDRDYIDFWRTISCYWALLVAYTREFERFHHHQELLVKYLQQRGLYVCDDEKLEDLRYLMENFYDEMRRRGTHYIALKKGESPQKTAGQNVNDKPNQVNGELLRLICYNDICDEFLFAISEFDNFGWVLNKWSPLWRGTTGVHQFNKLYEKSDQVQDLDNFATFGNTVTSVEDPSLGHLISIDSVPIGESAGIGSAVGVWDNEKATNVDPTLNYEISFWIRSPEVGNRPLTVGAYYYTADGTPLDLQKVNSPFYPTSSFFFSEKNLQKEDNWYFVRCIIYAHNTPIPSVSSNRYPDFITNFISSTESNLRFGTNLGCKMIPYVALDNSSGGAVSEELFIRNFRVSVASTPYSTGFIERGNFVQSWIKYNSGKYTQNQLNEIVKFYLLPYRAIFHANFI